MQEVARAVRQVVLVGDQAVLARLPRPVEVLHRVGDQEAVGAGHDAAAQPDPQHEPGEHGERQRGERRQQRDLDAVEPRAHPSAWGSSRAPCADTARTRRRTASRSRVTGTMTRGIDSREPARSSHGMPTSAMR